MIITIRVNAPMGQAIGVKEAIAMDLEKYGDVQVIEVRDERKPAGQQTALDLGKKG